MSTLAKVAVGVAIGIALIGVLIHYNVWGMAALPAALQSLPIQQTIAYVQANWQQVITASGGALTIGAFIYKWWQARSAAVTAAKEALAAKNTQLANQVQSNQIIDGYKSQIAALQTKLAGIESDPSLMEAQKIITGQTSQITSLNGQISGMQSQMQSFINQLMQAANGALISGPDGKMYSVLKLPPEIIVK